MAANATTLTEKMRAALRISSTSEKITEEINDCIAACKMDLRDVGVKKIDEKDALIIRAITLYCKSEFGYSDKSEKFWKSYECLKTHLSLSSEYTGTGGGDSGDLSVGTAGTGNVVTELAYDSKTGKFTATKGIKALTESDLQEITQQEIKALFA